MDDAVLESQAPILSGNDSEPDCQSDRHDPRTSGVFHVWTGLLRALTAAGILIVTASVAVAFRYVYSTASVDPGTRKGVRVLMSPFEPLVASADEGVGSVVTPKGFHTSGTLQRAHSAGHSLLNVTLVPTRNSELKTYPVSESGPIKESRRCFQSFVPPSTPKVATGNNGISLQDVCISSTTKRGGPHVFLIGDWGGIWSPGLNKPVTADSRGEKSKAKHRQFLAGVDEFAQLRVANAMRQRADLKRPDYVLNVGDNFYWGGLVGHCGTPVDHHLTTPGHQWANVYESVYHGPGLDAVPWLGVLGNHDYGGFAFTSAWDQLIAYTYTGGPNSTGRWITPAQYWKSKVLYDDFSVDYFFVDSNYFGAFAPVDIVEHNMCSGTHNKKTDSCGANLRPSSLQDCHPYFEGLWKEQLRWLEKHLEASSADWQIIVTHFPPFFAAQEWDRLTWKYGIDLLVAGHVHSQSMHVQQGRQLNYIISGGGGGITSEGTPDKDGHDDEYGFVDLTLSKSMIQIEMISHGGQLRNASIIAPRRPFSDAVVAILKPTTPKAPTRKPTARATETSLPITPAGDAEVHTESNPIFGSEAAIRADGITIRRSEKFVLVQLRGGTILLMAFNQRFVTIDLHGFVWANVTRAGIRGRFLITAQKDSSSTFRTFRGQLLSTFPDGSIHALSNTTARANHTFYIVPTERRSTVAIRAANGRYLSAHAVPPSE